jgi:hypothetical protein
MMPLVVCGVRFPVDRAGQMSRGYQRSTQMGHRSSIPQTAGQVLELHSFARQLCSIIVMICSGAHVSPVTHLN